MTHLDDKRDLYPASTTSFGSHNASPEDVPIGNENVEPGAYNDVETRVFKAVDGSGTHLSTAPSKTITLQEHKAVLDKPNAKVAPFHVESAVWGPEEIELPILCNSTSKVVRFVYSALRTIIHDRIPVADWDDNDSSYTNLAILAKSLHTGEIKLADLVYQPNSPLVREQTLIATAILAYIKMTDLKCKTDEELFEDWGNDRPLFFKGLRLEKLKEYPLFAEATRGL